MMADVDKLRVADALNRVKSLGFVLSLMAEGAGDRRTASAFADIGEMLIQRVEEALSLLEGEG